jgi:hypothetical protein
MVCAVIKKRTADRDADLGNDGSNPFAPTNSFRTNNLQIQIYSLTAWCRTRRSAVQIESLRLRYFPFSHRLTLRFRDVRQYVEIVQLVQHLSNDFTNGQGIRLFGGQEWMPNLFWRAKTFGIVERQGPEALVSVVF